MGYQGPTLVPGLGEGLVGKHLVSKSLPMGPDQAQPEQVTWVLSSCLPTICRMGHMSQEHDAKGRYHDSLTLVYQSCKNASTINLNNTLHVPKCLPFGCKGI